jgi:hypothetical protein
MSAELSADEAERVRLRGIARDVDPTMGSRTRILMLGILLACSVASALIARHLEAIGQLTPGVPVRTQFVIDEVQLASMLTVGALFTYRWMWLCAALTALGGLVGWLRPDLAVTAFSVTTTATILLSVLLVPRRGATGT